MKKAVPVILMVLMAMTAVAEEVTVSVLYVHYSVGYQMVSANCEIRSAYLDTMNIVVGTDTARIEFRSYHTNYEATTGALSETVATGCSENRFGSSFNYDLRKITGVNRTNIFDPWQGYVAGLLTNFFNVPNKENQSFWKICTTHNIPGPVDSVATKYDIILFKNPYATWGQPSQVGSDTIKHFYRAVRDSIANHPEINVGLIFGTPLRLGHYGQSDSATAKITHELASWFASADFFTHGNSGPYKNVWKLDSYRQLCETGNLTNKYCLAEVYHADSDPLGSHLSDLGAELSQASLADLIRQMVTDILLQRNNMTTRYDIDHKINEFRNGQATEEDVYQLIDQYNDQ